MRKPLIPLTILSAFFMLVFSIGFWLTKTDGGIYFIVNTINKVAPDTIEYDSLKGHLLGKLEINHLKVRLNGGSVNVNHVVAQSKFKFLTLKIVNEQLLLEKLVYKPSFAPRSPSKGTQFRLPITFLSKNILMNDAVINLGKKDNIILPPLRAKLLLAPSRFGINLYKLTDKKPCLSVFQKYDKTIFNLNTPYKKSNWKVHYIKKGSNYKLQGYITDQEKGLMVLQGNGQESKSFDLSIVASQIHPNLFVEDYWPSVVNFNLSIKQEKNLAQIQLKNLFGIIHNQNIQGNAHVILTKNKINDLLVDLSSSNSKVQIQGSKDDKWHVDWTLQIPDLNLFLPKSKGSITANGVVAGEASKPNFEGVFTIKDLNAFDYRVQDCSLVFKVDQQRLNAMSSVNLNASHLHIKDYAINSLQLSGVGSLKKHQITAEAKTAGQTANIKLDGHYISGEWTSDINKFTLFDNNTLYTLQEPSNLSVQKSNFALSPLCLSSGAHRICLAGNYQKDKLLEGNIDLQNFDLKIMNLFLGENQSLNGTINLHAKAKMTKSENNLVVNAILNQGALHYMSDNVPKDFVYQNAKFDAYIDNTETLQSKLSLIFKEGQLTSQLNIPKFNLKESSNVTHKKIQGNAKVAINQLHYMETLIPAIRMTSGKLLGNFDITGTLAKPIITGNFNLAQAGFRVPKLNLEVGNVLLDAKSEGNNVTLKGSLQSGNGTLNFNGTGKFDNGNLPLDLQLQGNNVLICNQPEIKITATPKMKLVLGKNDLKLTGELLIPDAKLHPHDFGNAETVSDDIVFINQEGKQIERNIVRISSDINLILGNNIFLIYKGIKGQILGQIHIQEDPNKATVAYGQLRLQDGTYSVYGKTLQIDTGKLNFTGGPISNPGLDIRASRSLQTSSKNSIFASQEQLRVGVNVLGSLKEPKITLFSEPSGKPPSDILSYLLLGIPADSVTGTNTELLMQAANTLGGSGPSKLLGLKDQLKSKLGLSELDIGTQSEIDPKTQETFQHTAFVLGKYLSPKFYVNYSLDLFDHTNTFKVRYLINRFWTIQSVANTNTSGVDIMYTVEK